SAHVAYLAAFVSIDHRPALVRALPFLGWGLGAFVLLRPGLGAMALPVGAYVAAICAMMWRAAAQVGSPGTSALAAALALVGAVCFGASDTLLAFARFSAPIPGVRWPIMALYWLGQGGIAASAVLGAERRRAGTGGGWGMLPGQVKTR
ncbi:MAG TPA: lysoplasmalogenase, partial [Vicinamibacteria bacterium]|nr:lysoplasmalogenase [Vicinamibacteria bacterium]